MTTSRRRQPNFEDDDDTSRPSLSAEQKLRKECGFSQLLVDDLKAHRLQITRAHLGADFEVAFDLALYALCIDLFEGAGYRSHPLELRASPAGVSSKAFRLTAGGNGPPPMIKRKKRGAITPRDTL